MYLEIAEIDSDGEQGTVHEFDDVLSFEHKQEGDKDKVYITLGNGTETVVGQGHGLDVVRAEEE